jgi:hypothetical protein
MTLGTEVHWDDPVSWLFKEMDLLFDEFNLTLVIDKSLSNN